MLNPISWLIDKIRGITYEPEYDEPVDHDIVIINGEEVTGHDPEKGQ